MATTLIKVKTGKTPAPYHARSNYDGEVPAGSLMEIIGTEILYGDNDDHSRQEEVEFPRTRIILDRPRATGLDQAQLVIARTPFREKDDTGNYWPMAGIHGVLVVTANGSTPIVYTPGEPLMSKKDSFLATFGPGGMAFGVVQDPRPVDGRLLATMGRRPKYEACLNDSGTTLSAGEVVVTKTKTTQFNYWRSIDTDAQGRPKVGIPTIDSDNNARVVLRGGEPGEVVLCSIKGQYVNVNLNGAAAVGQELGCSIGSKYAMAGFRGLGIVTCTYPPTTILTGHATL